MVLAAGDLATFRLGPHDGEQGLPSLDRAEAGRLWHGRLAQTARETFGEAARFEVAVDAAWVHERWTLRVQGRVDQLVPVPEGWLIREIKTVLRPLPTDPADLRADYPEYFRQLAAYGVLAPGWLEGASEPQGGELLFVSPDDGMTQGVLATPEELRASFEQQVATLTEYLESRRLSRLRRRELPFHDPFASWREGQEEARAGLEFLSARGGPIFFEAPTGFGKTAVALSFALTRMHEGKADRIIYLSAKKTGQTPVLDALRRMLPERGGARVVRFLDKQSCARVCPHADCDGRERCRLMAEERWERARPDPEGWFEGPFLSMARVIAEADATELCPWELQRVALAFAEVWIGDLNYLFSPRAGLVFRGTPDFSPHGTEVILDEGHNLPERVADLFSCLLRAKACEALAIRLSYARAGERLVLAAEDLAAVLEAVEPCERLDEGLVARVAEAVARVAAYVGGLAMEGARLGAETLEGLWAIWDANQVLARVEAPAAQGMEFLAWARERGELRVTCLEAPRAIAPVLREFPVSVTMSATLQPLDSLRRACGLETNEGLDMTGDASWRQGAYAVAVDARVDTRYRARGRSCETTAQTLEHIVRQVGGPVAVFFSSYAYAELVNAAIARSGSLLRVAVQPRETDASEREFFIEEALLTADVLLLVLGSHFAEGIDLLGGRVTEAVVVGPALPEVNAAQQAKLEARAHLPREAAFREVYAIPGMRKVNQALGRLVRGPGQRARVLLQGRRFTEPMYQDLLMPEYRGGPIIGSENDLLRWLEEVRFS